MRFLKASLITLLVTACLCLPKSAFAQSDPVQVLKSYVEAVNASDFETAYKIFLFPRTRYQAFADGWDDTRKFRAELGKFQPWRNHDDRGDIPGLLIKTLTNGVVETYQGCYFMILAEESWYVEDFSFSRLYRHSPLSSDITKYTRMDCSALRAQKGMITVPLPENLEAAVDLRELGLPVFRPSYSAVVVADRVAVRDRDTSAGNKLATLNYGDEVTILDGPSKSVRSIWWKVETSNGVVGWVAAYSDDGTQLLDLP